jgi:RNA polymerase sigma factor (sigma-70 family)
MLNNSYSLNSVAVMGAKPRFAVTMISSKRREQEQLFEETLNQYHAMISRVVSSYERNKALQEELYQEISMALWKALSRFNEQSALKTYILSICHKRAVSHVAKYAKEPFQDEIENHDFMGADCPSEVMSKNQKMQRLMQAIHRLGMSDRQLVTLSLEGLSYKETAEILGISVSNVGAKLNRAKQKLNQILGQGEKS